MICNALFVLCQKDKESNVKRPSGGTVAFQQRAEVNERRPAMRVGSGRTGGSNRVDFACMARPTFVETV